MLLNSNLELNKDDVELLQQFGPTQAASYHVTFTNHLTHL